VSVQVSAVGDFGHSFLACGQLRQYRFQYYPRFHLVGMDATCGLVSLSGVCSAAGCIPNIVFTGRPKVQREIDIVTQTYFMPIKAMVHVLHHTVTVPVVSGRHCHLGRKPH
jgi:hypothetical protein